MDLTEVQQQENIFKNLRLRRIVKENHGQDINQIMFHFTPLGANLTKTLDKCGLAERDESDTSNILATVGGSQANIYDNEHCGDHLDIMSYFTLSEGPNVKSTTPQELLTCCWLSIEDDTILAVAGQDACIHILSVACSKELRKLVGHSGAVTHLDVSPEDNQYILSASKDGTVRLWDVQSGTCLQKYPVKASAMCFNPSGSTFLSGSYAGEVYEWPLPIMTRSQLQLCPKASLNYSVRRTCAKYIGIGRFHNFCGLITYIKN
ncbi:WD40 repeat-like protein [Basidiobolus meristosporus CBS 931.73]|uniref:WD40 repeat-like protein n=1 Tax=Basidiobolus meristosporus CBS 931.73 TaxID=1314790 RepID=A0A1Y1XVM8_9FUNG|nr:WD40 repeat-like protein [Basidiobolus meristosporus CBS 931.73]|eukprot:ORX89811.1 WD40 repeat-like protein [Basidiobolus meristosporus CBS 931.73]